MGKIWHSDSVIFFLILVDKTYSTPIISFLKSRTLACKFFLVWLAMQNRLTTGDRMSLWNGNVDTSCVFCRVPIETRDHLFFDYSYSSQISYIIWEGFPKLGLKRWHLALQLYDTCPPVTSRQLRLKIVGLNKH